MATEALSCDFFPSAKVRLVIRFEEFSQEVLKNAAPKKPAKNLNGVKDDRAPLKAVPDPDSPANAPRFLLVGDNTVNTQGGGGQQLKSQDNLTHEIGGIIPKKASWKQNGVRTADEVDLELRWIDMPFDPRVIRACAVDYFLGTVTGVELAQGIRGVTRGAAFGQGIPNANEPLNLVADSYVDDRGRQRTNLRFQGWVDEWSMSWGDGEPLVKLKCVDNTRLFIKQEMPPKLTIGMEKPIDQAVAELISNFPQFEGMLVEYRPADEEAPKLKNILAGSAFRPNLGPPPAKGGAAAGGAKLTIWDYLTDVVGAIGHNIRIEGRTVIIQKLRDMFGGVARARQDDPYQGRSLPSGEYPVRAFIYGRNIKTLEGKRNFTQAEPTNIEVRCYSTRRKNMLVARYPAKDKRVTNANPGDGKTDQKWKVIPVAGIEDEATLKDLAEAYYNSYNRQELQFDLGTTQLASFGGDNQDPDLLDMKVGDSVEIGINRDGNFNTNTRAEGMLTALALNEELMGDLGYSKDLASAYAKAYTNAGFQRFYYTRAVQMDWSADSEPFVSIKMTLVNFVVVRLGTTDAQAGGGTT